MFTGKRVVCTLFSTGAVVVTVASAAYACSAISEGGEATDPAYPVTLWTPGTGGNPDTPKYADVVPATAHPTTSPHSVTVKVKAYWPTVGLGYSGTESVYMDRANSGVTGDFQENRVSDPGDCQQVVGDSNDDTVGSVTWTNSAEGVGTATLSPPTLGGPIHYVSGVFEVCVGVQPNDAAAGERPRSSQLKTYFAFI